MIGFVDTPKAASATPEPALYRRIIDWERRLAREGPVVLEWLALGAGSTLLDLGSGSGEHDRWLAARGVRVLGVDRSPEMVAAARESLAEGTPVSYVEGSLESLPPGAEGPFDAAMCLGNTLVHLEDGAALEAFGAGVARRLRPGGRLLVQILNYEAIVGEGRRFLAPVLRPSGDGGELAFLRFMDHREPGFVDFEAVVLERRAGEPSRLAWSRSSRVRAWTRDALVPVLERTVGPVRALGGYGGEPFDPARSADLLLLAERT